MTTAIDQLSKLYLDGYQPKKLDELYDMLKLLGVVLGQIALLEVVSNPVSNDEKAKVAAARALISLKEDPESIAERLRRSPFAELTIEELHGIVQKVQEGQTDLVALATEAKNGRDPERA
jgi:hypothetical protein